MKVEFKFPRSIDRRLYAPGVQDVSDSLKGNWFFEGLVKNGDIIILEDASVKVEVAPKEEMVVEVKEVKKKSKKDH